MFLHRASPVLIYATPRGLKIKYQLRTQDQGLKTNQMNKHISINVTGKVQGVFFRASAREKAEELGVKGFVRNEPDGGVYIEVEARGIILEQFFEWCRQDQPRAMIDKLEVMEGEV